VALALAAIAAPLVGYVASGARDYAKVREAAFEAGYLDEFVAATRRIDSLDEPREAGRRDARAYLQIVRLVALHHPSGHCILRVKASTVYPGSVDLIDCVETKPREEFTLQPDAAWSRRKAASSGVLLSPVPVAMPQRPEPPQKPEQPQKPERPQAVESGCNGSLGRVPVTTEPAGQAVDLRVALEGCVIVAEDGQMLGLITSNANAKNSFLNEFGPYGSKFSSTSIWNQFGKYGGQYSSKSPFNSYSTTPPRIIAPNGEQVGYLTVNEFLSPTISPYALAALME